MPRPGAVAQSDLCEPPLTPDCEPCGRRGVDGADRLYNRHHDAQLSEARPAVVDCPKRRAERTCYPVMSTRSILVITFALAFGACLVWALLMMARQ
jgi:hypothetical protein